jgi:hypothetical protein
LIVGRNEVPGYKGPCPKGAGGLSPGLNGTKIRHI